MSTRLRNVRALLIDLDGVLYVEDRPLPGARSAVERLRAAGRLLRFVTNTTAHSRAVTLSKLRESEYRWPTRSSSPQLRSPCGTAAIAATGEWLS